MPDERAMPLSERLERYRDTDASSAAFATSDSGLELMHTTIPWFHVLVCVALCAVFLLLAFAGPFSTTVGRGFLTAAGMYAGGAFLPFCRTARQFVYWFQWWTPLIFLTFSVAFFLDGFTGGDLFMFVFWTPLLSAVSLILRFRPGWYLRAFSAICLVGFVVQPLVQCIDYGFLETSSYGECAATEYRTWWPMVGVFGLMTLVQLAQTLAKHAMARRAKKASMDLHRLSSYKQTVD